MVILDLLPKDITIEILSRLPAKSLLKFKSVCKTWYALIRNPSFIDKHEKYGPAITSVLVKSSEEIYFREDGFYKALDFQSQILSDNSRFDIIGICNGLFCAHLYVDYFQQGYIIGNPTTRDFRRISLPELLDVKNIEHYSGFTSIHNEYKIVQVMYRDISIGSVDLKALVYNMNTDSWVEFDARVGHVYNITDYLGWHATSHEMLMFQNGVFYWGAGSGTDNDARVASFDISEGFYDEISIPADILGTDNWRIIEFKEEISLISHYEYSGRLELWSLNENTDSWTWRMRIDDIPIVGGPPETFGDFIVDYKNSELLVRDNDNEGVYRVLLFDLQSREVKILPSIDIEQCQCLYMYTEFLRSAQARNGATEGGVLA